LHDACRSARLVEPPEGDPERIAYSEQSGIGRCVAPVTTLVRRQLADPSHGARHELEAVRLEDPMPRAVAMMAMEAL
jgi:hypothetical protein